MTVNFFKGEMDYIFFFYGLSFFIVAAICFILRKTSGQKIPWVWLALFGLTHGVNEWLDLAALYVIGNPLLDTSRLVCMIVSFVFLTEFGRANLSDALDKKIGRRIFLPLLMFVACGWFIAGPGGLNAFSRYILGCAGGLCASFVLFRLSRNHDNFSRFWLAAAGAILGLYALTQTIVPPAQFFPASFINTKTFLHTLSIPIQFIRGILAVMLAVTLGMYWQPFSQYARGDQYKHPGLTTKYVFLDMLLVIVVPFILMAGWFFTEYLGKTYEKQMRSGLMFEIQAMAASFNPAQIAALAGSLDDIGKPEYRHLQDQLKLIRAADRHGHLLSASLLGLRSNKVFSFADSDPQNLKDYSPSGQAWEKASKELMGIFSDGQPVVTAASPEARGSVLISGFVPIQDSATQRVVAVLKIDMKEENWNERIIANRLLGILCTLILCIFIIGSLSILIIQREAMTKISASEDRFRVAFMSAPEAVFIFDAHTREILEVNPFMSRWLGLDSLESHRLACEDLFEEGVLDDKKDIKDRIKEGTAFSQEYLCKKKNDTRLAHVELTGVVVPFRGRQCVLAFMRYITERKRTEEELQRKEKYFRSLIENATDIVAILSADGAIKYASPSVVHVLGYKPADLIDKNVFDFIHAEDARRVMDTIAEAIREPGTLKSEEIRFRHRDGSWHVLSSQGRSHLNDPTINGIVVNSRDITKRKQAEEMLALVTRQKELILNSAGEGIIMLDLEGNHTFVNPVAAQMLGYKPEELIGRHSHPLWHHTRKDGSSYIEGECQIYSVLKDGIAHHITHEVFWRKDGQSIPVEYTSTPIIENDKITGVVVIFKDITERKETEDKLNDAKQKLESIAEGITDSVFLLSKDYEILWANRAAMISAGYKSTEELSGKMCYQVTHRRQTPCESPNDICPLQEIIKTGKPVTVTHTHFDSNGNKMFVDVTAYPVKGGKGEIIQFVHVGRDITERVKMEEENKDSTYRLQTVINSVGDGITFSDTEGRFLVYNSRMQEITGYTKEEVDNCGDFNTLIYPDPRERQKALARLGEFRDENVRKEAEMVIQAKDGSQKILLVSTAKMKYKGRSTFLSVYRDVTERYKAEQALQAANQELVNSERALKNMLYDLRKTHDELKNAQRQLLQSEKLAAIGQLAAGIAHEINNPVGFISSNLETLEKYIASYSEILRAIENLKTAVNERNIMKAALIVREITALEGKINFDFITSDIENLVRESKTGIERIKKIVMDLRTFSRAGGDTMTFANIEEVLDSILNIVWNEIKYKAELKKEYGQLPPIKCNAQQLGQVFINLLVNAAHAIQDKGTITIKTFTQGKSVYIEVIDTGSGIPKENLSKIFDPFFTTKPAGKGTGLGLSISYDIVKRHGGEIRVVSEVGRGSTFMVVLPVESSSV